MNTITVKKAIAAGTLLMAGAGGGAMIAAGGTATAASGTSNGSSSSASGPQGHAGETPLTGDTAAKVKAAALAKYAGATVDRLETDSDGVYEAHVTTSSGSEVIVQVGKDFTVTGTQAGGPGDRDGDGDGDGDGPDADGDGPDAGGTSATG